MHVTQSFNFRYKLTKSINSCSTDIHFLRNNSKSVNMHCDYVFDCNDRRFLLFSLMFLKSGLTAHLLVNELLSTERLLSRIDN